MPTTATFTDAVPRQDGPHFRVLGYDVCHGAAQKGIYPLHRTHPTHRSPGSQNDCVPSR